MSKLEIKNVTKTIKKRRILNNISFVAQSGQIIGITGPNGSGKTMLLKVITGLTSYDAGEVKLGEKIVGHDIEHLEDTGIIIENPQFINDLTAFQNLKFLASINNKITDNEIRSTLSKIGLLNVEKEKYKNFSLGMKQRLAFAQAIMEDQSILILDEPTNALDEDGIKTIEQILISERQKNKIIIIASHDSEFLARITDIRLRISEGHLNEMD
ncbi:heme ABC exporter, ATP-binding protein CcmA [Enterococcus sp. DIV2402]|uniref:Heme ABC exporter, ATP-binding protein CcmA n=1 Tax=Candidatus Enterococcus lowellii TaxID=2230877 RepID=A0ABZ2SM89_9ENTE|nr:ATP-binding cassette domain-containing protein [Enterococcus sp. DIV2402]MBO0464240.1 ATP-binding cassette domain-containing protein [Enterococcus sp. DIV2402]